MESLEAGLMAALYASAHFLFADVTRLDTVSRDTRWLEKSTY